MLAFIEEGGDVPHRGFLVLIYILNIFIATLLLASNSELLEDLVRCFGFVCIHFEIPRLKISRCLHMQFKGCITISSLNDS